MAQNDMLKRYLDAGIAFTQMTRARAEEIITELVKAGEIQRDQVQSQVDELIERSRRNTDQLVAMVRQEVAAQFSQLPVATKDDLKSLERWITERLGGAVERASAARSSTRSAGKSAAAKRPAGGTTTSASSTKSAAAKRPAPAKSTAAKATKSTTAKAGRAAKSTTAKAGSAAKSTTAKATKATKKTAKKASPSSTSSGA